MMKKYCLLVVSLMLIAILSACTGNPTSTTTPTTTPETSENSGNTAPSGTETTTPASTPSAEEAHIIANKQIVLGLYQDVFNGHQIDKVNQYIGQSYIEHNPYMENGRDNFTSLYTSIFKRYPDFKVNLLGMIGQGDLVAVFGNGGIEHGAATNSSSSTATSSSETTTTAGNSGSNSAANTAMFVELYRISNNQIVEHWEIEPNTTNALTPDKLPALSAKAELAATARATVAANASFVDNFFATFFVQHNTDIANDAVSDNVEQYGLDIPNGRKALVSHYLTDFRANPDSKATAVHTIAEGDLVLVYSHMQANATERGQAVIQLFQIKNGQIAALWTLSQPVPEQPANNNTMF
ncbi:ester cyclase [Paenibacillus campi]|uniref:nuclear transport factor 2 family protein n=1 Tax=Paenibacillus campi TaxID=3106031 RepID=UPI002B002CBC|nr:ester cyclase [Paenibacillus sp. SGZ-1014]